MHRLEGDSALKAHSPRSEISALNVPTYFGSNIEAGPNGNSLPSHNRMRQNVGNVFNTMKTSATLYLQFRT